MTSDDSHEEAVAPFAAAAPLVLLDTLMLRQSARSGGLDESAVGRFET